MYFDLLKRGFIKPESMEPDVTGFDFYFDALGELSTARPAGMGLSPIPFTAIVEYFKMYELRDFDEFTYIIRRLDNTFLELSSAEPAEKTGDKKKDAPANSNTKNHNQGRHRR